MSYVPFRDCPDLVGLPEDAYDQLVPLGDRIEESHGRGIHEDDCACTNPDCPILERALIRIMAPPSEVVMGYLIAKGLLDLGAVTAFVAGRWSDPKIAPPSSITAVTDGSGDVLVRLSDNTWGWATVNGETCAVPADGGHRWYEVARELSEGNTFVVAALPTSTQEDPR